MQKLDIGRVKNLRSKGGYLPYNNFGTKFKILFFPYMSGIWNSLPTSVQCKDLNDFKEYTKSNLKPVRYKHFSRGNKSSNTLLTKIRVGRSELNQHKYSIGLSETPECLCHNREESPLHYFIDCFLYLPERQALFSLIEHYIPHFTNLNKKQKLGNHTTWN